MKRDSRGASSTRVNAYVNEKKPFTRLTYELTVSAATGLPVFGEARTCERTHDGESK